MLGAGSLTSNGKCTKSRRITIKMNTAEIITLSLAVLAGVLIGAIFFGGLWWTVLYGLKVKWPALLFILSLTARFALALIGFYLVAGGHLERLVACLVGFIVSRVVIGRLMRCHRTLSDPRSAGALLASQTIPERQDSITPPPQLARTRTTTSSRTTAIRNAQKG
jgi:F1F0 ATPase subunit 2